ncbi:MAG: aminotransferase class V-fold PLP-dependent enzyme [Chthoniobacterales bacterium]
MSSKTKDQAIYLDNNATTEVDPLVFDEMMPWLRDEYGNPSSAYSLGKRSAAALDTARDRVAHLIGCEARELLFTSCGSESINSAIRSALMIDPDKQHIITSSVEHSATIKLCEHLATRGYEITWLPVTTEGHLDLEKLEKSIRPDTAIVSLLWANNETGVLFPIEKIAEICKKKHVLLHVDAVQAVGKVPFKVSDLPIHFLSLSGHKIHCPKGVGSLFISKKVRFTPWLIGGSQENNRRGGTQNVASIVALGKAAELTALHLHEETTRVRKYRDRFEDAVLETVIGSSINGDRKHRLPNTTNIAFEGIESEGALMLLDDEHIYCSAGSACTAGSVHPSHVLKAMGMSDTRARSSLRFSFGRFNTDAQIERAIEAVPRIMEKIRRLSPSGSPVIPA